MQPMERASSPSPSPRGLPPVLFFIYNELNHAQDLTDSQQQLFEELRKLNHFFSLVETANNLEQLRGELDTLFPNAMHMTGVLPDKCPSCGRPFNQ